MTTALSTTSSRTGTVFEWHRPLVLSSLASAVLLTIALAGLVVDGRTLVNDQSIWLKPAKFALSLSIYNMTIAWLLSLLVRWRRAGWWLGTALAVLAIGEIAIITFQALRGEMSHFNMTTPLNAVLYSLMGLMITGVWVANLAIGIILMGQRIGDRATSWAVRGGVAIALGGMALGPLMTTPTAAQIEGMEDGVVDVIGAHTVGIADGGPGLPFVGWSTVAGDLRVAHFFGLHGLQVMILFALLLVVFRYRLPSLRPEAVRLRLVTLVGLSYTGMVALLTWQALRGQSVVRPDELTLAAAGVLLVATAAGLWWSLRARDTETDISPKPPRSPSRDRGPDQNSPTQ